MTIMRTGIAEVMAAAGSVGDTVEERNAHRRTAVEEFLSDKPNGAGPGGTIHDMILSDLPSYAEWEKDG